MRPYDLHANCHGANRCLPLYLHSPAASREPVPPQGELAQRPWRRNATASSAARAAHLQVWSFEMLSRECCEAMVAEVERYYGSGLPISRPNSMNNYGGSSSLDACGAVHVHVERTSASFRCSAFVVRR